MAITLPVRPITAQISYKGYTLVSYVMDEPNLLRYVGLANVQNIIDTNLSKLVANGYMPELIIVNGGESIRYQVFSIGPILPNYFDRPRR